MMRPFLLCLLALTSAAPLPRAQDPTVPPPQQPQGPPASGQQPQVQQPAGPTPSDSSRAALQDRLDATKSDDTIAADLKLQLSDVYGRALEAAKAAEQNVAAARTFADQVAAAPTRVQELHQQLDRLGEPTSPPPGAALADLEQGLARKQLDATNAATTIADLEKESRKRTERRTSVPPLIAERRKQIDALPEQAADAPDTDPRLVAARRLARQAERSRLQSEIDALTGEITAYDTEEELLRARRDLATRQAATAKAEVEAWQAALQRARATAAQQSAKAAAEQVEVTDSRIVGIAEENVRLATMHKSLTERLARLESEKTSTTDQLDRLSGDFREVQKRVVQGGASDTVGALLRQRRTWLADQRRSIVQRSRNRGERIADTQLQKLDIDEQRQTLIGLLPHDWLQQQLAKGLDVDALEEPVLAEAYTLRKARLDLLTRLQDDYRLLFNTQTELETKERSISTELDAYGAFLAEHVLGIRSSAPVWHLDVAATIDAVRWFADARTWLDVAGELGAAVTADLWPLLLAAAIAALMALRPWLRRRLAAHGELAMRGSNIAYAPTAYALMDTCLLALPVPALLWLVAWRVNACAEPAEFGKAIAGGANRSAALLVLLALMRALVRPRGLGEAHFRWQSATLKQLRRNLPLLTPAAFPLAFVVGALEARANQAWLGSLGNLALLTMFALLLIVAWRTLHPTTGLIGGGMPGRSTALHRFRRLWFVLGFGTPLTLAVMAVLGYDYTAMQLSRRLLYTVAAVVLGVLVHAFVLRGLVLERRRLQIRQAEERRAAQKLADGSPAGGEAPPLEEIDPQSLARQTQTLLRGALTIAVLVIAYQIWVDVLPALGMLRRVTLWPVDNGIGTDWITLADVLLSLFALIAAIVAARNLPALLELLVLQRFKMQAGERNAIATLAKYGIVIVGLLLAFSSIGIGWSKVQWLVAAVSVGLGFGLQEIFANFVSGLILLFERPIRVGDIVSVGDVVGRVNRIRIRATTIQDWERKELVVPNKEFVTGHFVNWTLSDSVVRWTIPVGVAYGSDTQKALDLLGRVAAESPHVLRDPRPEAVFVKFGDSTLDLQLRVFVDMSALDYRWMTELHQAIDRAFRSAGIEIAFPQRDINVKAVGPLLELLQRPGGLAAHARER